MNEITLFATIQPPPPDDAEEIRQGARTRLDAAMSSPPRPARHRRRPLVLAGVATAVVAVAASMLLAGVRPAGSRAPAAVHVNLAAWSVNTNPDGTVTVKTRNLAHPRRLEHVLAEAGIPALVRWGELCTVPRSQYLPTRGIVDGPDFVGGLAGPAWIHGVPEANDVWTFTPSRMPPGTRYMITAVPPDRVPSNRGDWTWGLIRDSAHVTCGLPAAPAGG